jgi:hypothetical protein
MINILKMVKIELGKRDFGWIGLLIVLVGVGFVYGFGTGNPAVFGHSAGEISVDDAFCKKITGHGCGFDADTNAASICEDNKYLKGDGTCVAGKNVNTGVGATTCECSGADLPYSSYTQSNHVYKCGEMAVTSVSCTRDGLYHYLCSNSKWALTSTSDCPNPR